MTKGRQLREALTNVTWCNTMWTSILTNHAGHNRGNVEDNIDLFLVTISLEVQGLFASLPSQRLRRGNLVKRICSDGEATPFTWVDGREEHGVKVTPRY